ncbi:uncharacterized protein VTP21DRAFT_9783 [Calcarisporiella thermophila]|uniref:uncharacterized protein n=1 Tax=Calcarisporiella thermophila TaxID=911321 RepID=UPI0037448231
MARSSFLCFYFLKLAESHGKTIVYVYYPGSQSSPLYHFIITPTAIPTAALTPPTVFCILPSPPNADDNNNKEIRPDVLGER